MNNLSVRSRLFIKKNSSTILTTIGSVGVVATAVLAVKATPKAMTLLEEAKKEKGEELTRLEIVKVAGKVYVPTVLTGVSTIACIFGSNILNHRQQAALMSAYALLDNSFKEYKKKLIELHGQETHEEVMNAIAIEKANDIRVSGSYFCSSCDLTADERCGEPVLFYEEWSGRYFEATIEQVLQAEYHINRNYILRGYSYLNELYEFLGLEETDYGSVLGWTPRDEGEYWLEFNHRKVTLDDGLECYILEMPFEPSYDFLEYDYY